MDTIDTRTAAITALLDGVTNGPWEWAIGEDDLRPLWTVNMAQGQGYLDWDNVDATAANARFITASRQLVPALLAERDAALARVAELEGVRDRYRQFISDEVMAELDARAALSKEPTP